MSDSTQIIDLKSQISEIASHPAKCKLIGKLGAKLLESSQADEREELLGALFEILLSTGTEGKAITSEEGMEIHSRPDRLKRIIIHM